jgi:hypothetical protein
MNQVLLLVVPLTFYTIYVYLDGCISHCIKFDILDKHHATGTMTLESSYEVHVVQGGINEEPSVCEESARKGVT